VGDDEIDDDKKCRQTVAISIALAMQRYDAMILD
jgi:hypothetical protein